MAKSNCIRRSFGANNTFVLGEAGERPFCFDPELNSGDERLNQLTLLRHLVPMPTELAAQEKYGPSHAWKEQNEKNRLLLARYYYFPNAATPRKNVTHEKHEKYALHVRHVYFALIHALIGGFRAFVFHGYLLRYPFVHQSGLVHAM